MKSNPAVPGGSLVSKPTWSNTFGCSATSAFFVFGDSGPWQPGGGTAMHTNYLSPAMRQLRDQQVRLAPRERQIQQADSAEELLNELDPKRTYTCQYVCHRVTNNGHESDPALKFTGKEARHDLRLFVEDLSDTARMPASAAGQRVLTVDELARQFRVSTKTVSRWREQGLVSRRFLFDGRKRLGFLQSSVDRFVALNEEQSSPRRPVQPVDGRAAQADHPAGAVSGPGGRMSRDGRQADCRRDGPQRGDDPAHAQAIRPGTS